MFLIPNTVIIDFNEHLGKRGVAATYFTEYTKWLRYYLDFCDKYPVPNSKSERVRLFAEKLREKKQSEKQIERAAHAISLYFEMQRRDECTKSQLVPPPVEQELRRYVNVSQEGDVAPFPVSPRLVDEFRHPQAGRENASPVKSIELSYQVHYPDTIQTQVQQPYVYLSGQ